MEIDCVRRSLWSFSILWFLGLGKKWKNVLVFVPMGLSFY